MLPEIDKTFQLPAQTADAREKQAEVQGQLCGVLQVIVQKLSEEEDTKAGVLPYADQVRSALWEKIGNMFVSCRSACMLRHFCCCTWPKLLFNANYP